MKTFGTLIATLAVATVISAPVTLYSTDTEAKGSRSSSSFRSSGTRSSSFKSYRSSKPAAKAKAPAPKAVPKAKPKPKVVKTKSNGGMNRTQLASKQKTSKAAYAATSSKYKTKSSVTPTPSTPQQRSFVRNASRNNDYGTYYSRRSNYYSGYHAPSYVYGGRSSFGVWDTMFLYYMLSTPSHAGSFGYNHYGDPGYSSWRAQANTQAKENADLQAQLDAMDAKINGMSGERNANYIPPGTDADLVLASSLVEANKPTIRMCTGEADGTYTKVANILKRSVTSAEMQLVPTTGSVQNLQYMADGRCDAAFTQSDAYWTYYAQNKGNVEFNLTRIPLGFRETAHLVCNAQNDADDINELTAKNTVYLGQQGSGASVTWSNLLTENSDLRKIQTAFATRQEIQRKVGTDANACLLYVGAIDSDRIKTLNSMSERVTMLDIDDSDYLDIVNPVQSKVYMEQEIDDSHYANLHDSDYGWTWDIDTITVGAEIAVSDRWAKQSGDTVTHKVMKQMSSVIAKIGK